MKTSPRRTSPPSPRRIQLHIDGAARGNPGPAGVGAVLTQEDGRPLCELSFYLGQTTNNIAESCALIIGLQEVFKRGIRRVKVMTDSELLQRQICGTYRVRDKELQWLHVLIRHLIEGLEHFEIHHVPREKNKRADRLADQAVTAGLKGQATFW